MTATETDLSEEVFCAFLDLMGFTDRLSDYENALSIYIKLMDMVVATQELNAHIHMLDHNGREYESEVPVRWRIVSDSIILTSKYPDLLALWCAAIQCHAVVHCKMLVRGGIGFGKHYERVNDGNYIVVSEALRMAYYTESKLSKTPRVVVNPEALLKFISGIHSESCFFPLKYDVAFQGDDSLWFLNPFFMPVYNKHEMYCEVVKLCETYDTAHEEKYAFFANLFNFCANGHTFLSEPQVYFNDWETHQYNNKLSELHMRGVEEDIGELQFFHGFANLPLCRSRPTRFFNPLYLCRDPSNAVFSSTFSENVSRFGKSLRGETSPLLGTLHRDQ